MPMVITTESSVVGITDVCLAVHEGKEKCSQNESSVTWCAKKFCE